MAEIEDRWLVEGDPEPEEEDVPVEADATEIAGKAVTSDGDGEDNE